MAKKTANIKAKVTKSVEEKQIGAEPKVGSIIGPDDILGYYNSYNYFYGRDEAKQFLVDWFKGTDNKTARALEQVPSINISTTAGWIARMLSRECTLPDSTMEFFRKKVEAMVLLAEEPRREKEVVEKPSIRENQYIAELESIYDSILLGEKPEFDATQWFQAHNVPLYAMKEVADYYAPMIEEIDFVQKSKDIESCLSKSQAKILKQWLESIVAAVEAINDNRKRQRKPRKPRAKKPDQLLKHFAYLKEDHSLNVASINPEKILGATVVYAFNVKTRTLIKFVSEEGKKLSVNRTSIINFDPKKSGSKTIRKPSEVIPGLTRQTKREMQRTFTEIRAKEKELTTSRLNDQCLIISAFP